LVSRSAKAVAARGARMTGTRMSHFLRQASRRYSRRAACSCLAGSTIDPPVARGTALAPGQEENYSQARKVKPAGFVASRPSAVRRASQHAGHAQRSAVRLGADDILPIGSATKSCTAVLVRQTVTSRSRPSNPGGARRLRASSYAHRHRQTGTHEEVACVARAGRRRRGACGCGARRGARDARDRAVLRQRRRERPGDLARWDYGIGGPGQVPPGPTRVSPCALCAGSALLLTVITTQGFLLELVRWQIVVLPTY
jgi:hypothetical protein